MLKRAVDLVGAMVLGVVLLPVAAAVAVVVRVAIGSPVLFEQLRPGRHGVPFVLYKFRTMAHEDGSEPSTDDDRIGGAGHLLREWSLDEIPELWNVVRGDMSLVGPRPLLMEYLPLYSPEQARRHDVRPGLTGLAQVLDRNDTTWERRLRLDVWYVDHRSIWLDLRILAMTVARVLSRSGVSAPGVATMPRFDGGEA